MLFIYFNNLFIIHDRILLTHELRLISVCFGSVYVPGPDADQISHRRVATDVTARPGFQYMRISSKSLRKFATILAPLCLASAAAHTHTYLVCKTL